MLPMDVVGLLGEPVQAATPLAGGCIGEVFRVDLKCGDRVVLKLDRARPFTGQAQEGLAVEGAMLAYLAAHSTLPVPAVRHAAPGLLVMDFVPGESHFDVRAERHAAELLAKLHAVRAPEHGFAVPTLIGGLHQPNPVSASWVPFFAAHRVRHMAQEGVRAGIVPADLMRRVDRLCQRLPELLEEPAHPSLLHGDVWTTNVLARNGQITAFLDPALYYGHPEMELAFITLFHTFGAAFFDAYHALRPIAPGFFEGRRDLYNLYPLLVHARLFGPSYLAAVERTLARHGC